MRFKIATKIAFGFGLVVIAVLAYGVLTLNAIQKNQNVNETISNVYSPSLEKINKLEALITDSRMLIKSWVYVDQKPDAPDKIKLKGLINKEFPQTVKELDELSKKWDSEEHKKELAKSKQFLYEINMLVTDTLFKRHQYIMDQLSTFESYEDPFIFFEVNTLAEEGGEVMLLTDKALTMTLELQASLNDIVNSGRVEIVEQFRSFKKFIYFMSIFLVLASVIIGVVLIRSLARPINRTKEILLQMSKGILPKGTLKEGSDEVGQMAFALNSLVEGLKNVSDFTVAIGKGNFETKFTPMSEGDALGYSLLEMRDELRKAQAEEEKRKEENQQRNWASQGVALFSDIMRKNNDNIEALAYEIISNMVRYTNSNQGGIFIVNDNDKSNIFLEMSACYAYDRQKFLKKKIEVGEGLVGRCYQEQEKIFLTDIPNDYIKITSGLGENNPTSLLLIPLAYNDNIFGIMEVASFNIFQEFEIEFMERIGESIAATISSVKANIQTALLLEQSQQQAEEMSSQEEEMRQNMEELRATQEQSARREEELLRELESLRKTL
ncbi:MAG: GAF domain-containing protein [Bacteroidales bacterium]|nr:GAF domain-containing protein [Bacteroidales bacterium]